MRLWAIFFTYVFVSLTYSIYIINLTFISNFLWPSDSFSEHALEIGLSITSRSWMWALSGMIFGNLADRFSRKTLLIISISFLAIGVIFNAFLPVNGGNSSLLYFVIGTGISGFGIGGVRPIILSFTNDLLKKSERSQFFGLYFSINQIASVVGMILSSFMYNFGFWQEFHLSIGVFLIIGSIFVMFTIQEPQRARNTHETLSALISEGNYEYDYTLSKETIKSTIIKPTNILAFIEGVFTCVLFDIIIFLVVPYVQSPPFNIGSSSLALLFVMFGLPGALIGGIVFAKLSDRVGKKDIKNRVELIVWSIIGTIVGFVFAFLIPIPEMTKESGQNFPLLLTNPRTWVLGILLFIILGLRGIYSINQPPILQAINLPEAQGFISSLNQSLEIFASGLAPLIGGLLLSLTSGNYLLSAFLSGCIGIPGAILWYIAKKKIDGDIADVHSIIQSRVDEFSRPKQG